MPSSNLIFMPPIIAHRGASAFAPENTLSAFKKAKELGVKWIEFDVTLTKSNEVVLIHDETLHRTTSGKGNVIDFSFDFLKTLDAGSWFKKEFSDQRIPSLSEALLFINKENLFANIEIKWVKGKEEELAMQVAEIIKLSKITLDSLLISSFSKNILTYFRKYSKESHLGFLMHHWDEEWEFFCEDLKCVSVNLHHTLLSSSKVKNFKQKKYIVAAYVVNNPLLAKKLFSWGVDALFSDCPASMLEFLK